MSILRSLSVECLNARKPCRQLDVAIALATGWTVDHICNDDPVTGLWKKDGKDQEDLIGDHCPGAPLDLPFFTASIDAAKLLIGELENPFVYLILTDFGGLFRARVSNGDDINCSADGHTEALTLCAAALRALDALQQKQFALSTT